MCWGFHSVVIRFLIQEGVDPFLIGEFRLLIGSALLALFLFLSKTIVKKEPYPRIRYSLFFWIIALSLTINFVFFHKGLEFTIASDAILLEAFSPIMVLIIVMFFIPKRLEHLMNQPGLIHKIFGVVILGSIGSSLLLINDPKHLVTSYNLKFIGDILEFLAMLAWALVLLGMHEYQKREHTSNIIAATSQFLFCAAILIAPFVSWSQVSTLSQNHWFWIGVLGVFSTAGAYLLWHIASKYLDVLPLITLFNLASIFTVITESLVLGLTISWKLFLGGMFILYAAMQAKMINSKYKILGQEEMPDE